MSSQSPPGGAADVLERLAALEDERSILRTLYAYGHAIDGGDEARWLDCFAEDGRFSASGRNRAKMGFDVVGKPELADFISRHTRRPGVFHQHLLIEPFITVDGDTARSDAYFLVLMRFESSPRIRAFGRYEDELRRDPDGRWRIVHRHANIDGADSTLPAIAFQHQPEPV